MKKLSYINILFIFFLSAALVFSHSAKAQAQEEKTELLPSWNDGPAKNAILDYIRSVISADSDDFLEEKDRIAVFRDDGVLVCEKPMVQRVFLLRSLKRLAKKDPKLARQEPFKSAVEKGMDYIEKMDDKELDRTDLIIRKAAGKEFYKELEKDFVSTAKHPHFDALYTDLVYQPMRELMSYLRAVGFSGFIISSGDINFLKDISDKLYGVSSDRVLDFETFKSGVGKKPILTAGRMKDGEDVEILLYSQNSRRPTLQMLIEHDDKEREFKYGQDDRESLNAAKRNNWLKVSMKNDWGNIFPITLKKEPAEEKPKPAIEEKAPTSEEPTATFGTDPQIGITRPLQEKGPTNVYIGFYVIDIDEVDTVKQSFTANVFGSFQWWDPRLAHGGTGVVRHNISDIWSPRLILLNQQRTWKTFPPIAEVNSAGEVTIVQRIWGYLSQPLNLRDFPFDEQTLNFTLELPGYNPQEVKLLLDETSGFGMSKDFSVPDWEVIGKEYTTQPFIPIEGDEISAMTFSLKVKRHSAHYVYKVVIPLVLIVMMSWIVFWIDPKEIGTNVAAATTSFLTLVAYRFAIGTYLPEISYFTRPLFWFLPV